MERQNTDKSGGPAAPVGPHVDTAQIYPDLMARKPPVPQPPAGGLQAPPVSGSDEANATNTPTPVPDPGIPWRKIAVIGAAVPLLAIAGLLAILFLFSSPLASLTGQLGVFLLLTIRVHYITVIVLLYFRLRRWDLNLEMPLAISLAYVNMMIGLGYLASATFMHTTLLQPLRHVDSPLYGLLLQLALASPVVVGALALLLTTYAANRVPIKALRYIALIALAAIPFVGARLISP